MISGAQIRARGRQIVLDHPEEIGSSAIVAMIAGENPDMPSGFIRGAVWDLNVRYPNEIEKTSSGAFRKVRARAVISSVTVSNGSERTVFHPEAMPEVRAGEPLIMTLAPPCISPAELIEGADREARIQRERADKAETVVKDLRLRISALEDAAAIYADSAIGVVQEERSGVLMDIRSLVGAADGEESLAAVQRIVSELERAHSLVSEARAVHDGSDSQRLRTARVRAGLTQPELGKSLGYKGRHAIDYIERGIGSFSGSERIGSWVKKIEAHGIKCKWCKGTGDENGKGSCSSCNSTGKR